MPWHVEESDSCPADEPWAVIKDSDGAVVGCHDSESDAEGQMAALYANESASAPLGAVERRTFSFETRITGEGPAAKIEGYAALFDSPSEEMGFFDKFTEKIARGAFDSVLGNDVRALVNHDPNYVLGRTRSSTLRLSSDARGLHTEITPPDTQWARDLVVSMKRGDIDQMSFGFTVAKGGEHAEEDGAVRIIDRVGRLFDVSVVTYPAYPSTHVQARARIPAPKLQREPRADRKLLFTAVSISQLNRRLSMARAFDLQHKLTTKGKANGNVD